MKARFGLAALDAIKKNYDIFLERLIKGYEKVTGKKPEGIELTMIKREAYQKAEDSAKVVDMKGKTLDPSKPIMGGKQDFGEGIREIYDEAKGPGKGDEMVEALKSPGARKSTEIIEKQIQETFPDIKLFGDETFEEILEIQRTGKHPRMKADGGRINFRTGGPTGAGSLPNIIGIDLMSPGIGGLGGIGVDLTGPGLGSLGGIEEEDEFADIRGQTAGIGLFGPISKGLQSIFGPKLGAAVFENYVRRPSINKGMEAIKKANDIAYAKRMELEEKMRQAAALKAAQEEISRMGYQDYGSGGGLDPTLNDPVTGEYTGRGDVGATTANQRGEFATDSLSYDLKDGGLATMFVERR